MRSINLKGLKCPIPVLKAYKILKEEKIEKDFEFISDDKSSPKDFKDLCDNAGYKLVGVKEQNKIFHIRINLD
tara:strand:+ start:55 stop:273 length:219 start_codon:yes stop_codon:yes gene_type:complete